MRACVLVVAVAACRGSAPPAASKPAPIANRAPAPLKDEPPMASPNKRLMSKMRGFAYDMCECSDSACGQQVATRMTAWTQEDARDRVASGGPSPTFSPDEESELQAVGTRMGDCMTRVIGGTTP